MCGLAESFDHKIVFKLGILNEIADKLGKHVKEFSNFFNTIQKEGINSRPDDISIKKNPTEFISVGFFCITLYINQRSRRYSICLSKYFQDVRFD